MTIAITGQMLQMREEGSCARFCLQMHRVSGVKRANSLGCTKTPADREAATSQNSSHAKAAQRSLIWQRSARASAPVRAPAASRDAAAFSTRTSPYSVASACGISMHAVVPVLQTASLSWSRSSEQACRGPALWRQDATPSLTLLCPEEWALPAAKGLA